MAERFRYEAFISYSHSDRVWADWLHRAIETYRIPKRLVAAGAPTRLSPIFRDRDELPSANDLGEKIDEALTASRCLIIICSPRAAQSRWVNEEIVRFARLGRSDQIFCLIVEGEPYALQRGFDAEVECFPAPLRGAEIFAEPIAADVRAGGDGKDQAKLKVIAGMLGVGLDDLRRRDLKRRNRRLVWMASASLVAVAITSTLAVVAWVARNEAEANRVRAERETETARATAQFMEELFNVVDPGEARGRTVTAYEILERGVDRIETSLGGEPEVRSTLLETMGKVFTGLGLYPRAVELLEHALSAGSTVVRPKSLTMRIALANALYLAGRYNDAEAGYRSVIDDLGNVSDWSVAHSDAENGLADVLTQKDALVDAIALYRNTLARDSARWGRDDVHSARTANGLATALLYQGDTRGAEKSYEQALVGYRVSLGHDHPKVAETINNLGAVRYFAGDAVGAAEFYRQALPLYRKLYGEAHPEVAMILNNLGRIELERLNVAAALPLLEESVAMDRSLGRADHDDIVYSLQSLGLAYREVGKLEVAERLLDEAGALAASHRHRMWGPILVSQADLLCATDRAERAAPLLVQAEPLIRATYPDEPWRMAILDSVHGFCMCRSGEEAIGYQLLRAALPVIEDRWGPDSLFTHAARDRVSKTNQASKNERPKPDASASMPSPVRNNNNEPGSETGVGGGLTPPL